METGKGSLAFLVKFCFFPLLFLPSRDPESRSQLEKQRDLLRERKTHQLQQREAPESLEEAAHHHNDAKARLDELREGKQKKNKKNRQKVCLQNGRNNRISRERIKKGSKN